MKVMSGLSALMGSLPRWNLSHVEYERSFLPKRARLVHSPHFHSSLACVMGVISTPQRRKRVGECTQWMQMALLFSLICSPCSGHMATYAACSVPMRGSSSRCSIVLPSMLSSAVRQCMPNTLTSYAVPSPMLESSTTCVGGCLSMKSRSCHFTGWFSGKYVRNQSASFFHLHARIATRIEMTRLITEMMLSILPFLCWLFSSISHCTGAGKGLFIRSSHGVE